MRRQLNTLNDCNAEDRFPSSECRLYLAIWPKHPPVSGEAQLKLQGSATLRRPGYISIRKEYLVHQSVLQPYDWNEPTDYYRPTQKSFAVVVAKLDTIYYSTRLAKLEAEIMTLMAVKEALSDLKHREDYVAAKAANLNTETTRLLADRNSLPPRQPRSDRQPEQAYSQARYTKAVRVKPGTPASLGKIKPLVFMVLLVAAMIGARSRADPASGEWLFRRFFETLMQVWMVALAISWEVGKLVAAGLWLLGKTIAALGGWFGRRTLSTLVKVSKAAWTTGRAETLIEAGYRVLWKAIKELMDGGYLPAGLPA